MRTTLDLMMEDLAKAMKPATELFQLSAIWINRVRFAPGELINYDPTDSPTVVKDPVSSHKIISCWGMLNDTYHEIKAEDIDTKEIITIKL